MAVQQIMAFLEKGEIKKSVNFPRCSLEQKSAYRLLVANRNIPNMVGQMTTLLAGRGVNITDLINQSRGDIAYNILDTDQPIPPDILEKFSQVEGIIKVRMVNKDV
jgi:D-3-phosphoglycerate dehydrogenase